MATFDGVPLLTALKWGKDLKSKGWIQTIVAGVPMLERLPHKRVAGRVWEQEMEATLPNNQFRNVNETYDADYGENDSVWWGTAILGGELRVDIAELYSGVVEDDAEFRADQYAKHAKSTHMRYSWEAINGTGAAKGFKGLFTLAAEGYGQIHDPGSDTGLSFDELDEALLVMENGDPDILLMNKEIAMRFSHRARSGYTQFTLVDTGQDALGRNVKRYNGIPFGIVRRGRTSTNTTVQILPFTENGLTALTGGSTSSIYACRYSTEDGVCGLLGKQGQLFMRPLRESTEGPYEVGRLEFYPGIAVLDPLSVVRYARITNA